MTNKTAALQIKSMQKQANKKNKFNLLGITNNTVNIYIQNKKKQKPKITLFQKEKINDIKINGFKTKNIAFNLLSIKNQYNETIGETHIKTFKKLTEIENCCINFLN